MAKEKLYALVSPAGNIPAYISGAPIEPPLAGRTNSAWGLLGQHGFPTLSVPAGFTTQVFDRVRDAGAPGGTRLSGPVPAKLPVGVMLSAARLPSRRCSGSRRRTRLQQDRIPPPDFGPVPEP